MKDKKIEYMICNDKQIKMTRDTFDYLMTIKHYNNKLKEYITNLQEKYERMKENAEILSNGYNKLEKRNEKAIEYGNNCLENIKEYDEYMCESIDIVGLLRMIHKNYLDILQGEDKDE